MANKKDTTTNIGRDAKTGRFISLKKAKHRKSTTTVATTKKKK
jgi:hypothetical protein